MQRTGIVIQSTGSWYRVEEPDGTQHDCRIRGRLRLSGRRTTNPVAVGDTVDFEPAGAENASGAITAIHPRRNYLIRRASNLSKESHVLAANLDRVLVVATLFDPPTSFEFIDRMLVSCEAYHIPATILLNKFDLAEQIPEALDAFRENYVSAGYPVLTVSALDGRGLDTLRTLLAEGTTLLAGNSGTGKSTLVRTLIPDAEVRTAQVSDAHHKGRHTTTFARRYPLPGGGALIDTPGVKGFGLIDIAPEETARYFPDLARFAPRCQYYNCTHTHEPHCAVQRAVAEGLIAPARYESYLKILEEDEKYRR